MTVAAGTGAEAGGQRGPGMCQRQHSALTAGPFHRRGRAMERRDRVGDEGRSYVPDDLERGLAGTVSLHERSAGPKQVRAK